MKYNRSFTLIELLVVIAIIGLLASIVTVNVNSAREKAKIAKSIQFSSSLYHALGADAVGYWDFNEGSGLTARDLTGNGNTGTLVNDPTWVDSLVFSGGSLGKALSFDGVNDCVSLAETSLPTEITVEAWVNMTPTSAGHIYAKGVLYGGAQGVALRTYGGSSVTFFVGNGTSINGANKAMSAGAWHHLAGTYSQSGDTKPRLYIDGQLVTTGNAAGNVSYTGVTTVLGVQWSCGGEAFNGLIDEVRNYATALSSAEIQKHYAEGLERHQLAKQ